MARRWRRGPRGAGLVVGALLLLAPGGVWSGENDEQCASVFKEDGSNGVLSRVRSTLFSVGYVGSDTLRGEDTELPCHINIAKMINKGGKEVSPDAYSAQAAVRSNGVKLAGSSQCPMLGFCADIMDASSTDAWPITTLTWLIIPLQSTHAEHDCGKMKLLQEYLTWLLLDDQARDIARFHDFGSMPGLLAAEFLDLVHKMKCSGPGEPEFVSDRKASAMVLEGAGSSLQGELQSALTNEFFLQFGKSVNYSPSSSGDGQLKISSNRADFAGTDAYLDINLPGLASRQFRMIPIFAAAVAIVFNPHILGENIVLTREEVVSIFMGQTVAWPRVNGTQNVVPAVLRVVRGDRSGTTESFTKALYFFSGVGEGLTTPDYNLHGLQGSALPDWPAAQVPYAAPTVCTVQQCYTTLCQAGQRLDEAVGICVPCPKETYLHADQHQISECLPCEPGTFAQELGSSQCLPCTELFSLELQGRCVSTALFFPALLIPAAIVLTLCGYIIHRQTKKLAQHLHIINQDDLIFADPPQVLGSGICGMVLRAEYRGTSVAVKRVIAKQSTWDVMHSSTGSGMESEGRTPLRLVKRGISMVFDQALMTGPPTPSSSGRLGSGRQASGESATAADLCLWDGASFKGASSSVSQHANKNGTFMSTGGSAANGKMPRKGSHQNGRRHSASGRGPSPVNGVGASPLLVATLNGQHQSGSFFGLPVVGSSPLNSVGTPSNTNGTHTNTNGTHTNTNVTHTNTNGTHTRGPLTAEAGSPQIVISMLEMDADDGCVARLDQNRDAWAATFSPHAPPPISPQAGPAPPARQNGHGTPTGGGHDLVPILKERPSLASLEIDVDIEKGERSHSHIERAQSHSPSPHRRILSSNTPDVTPTSSASTSGSGSFFSFLSANSSSRKISRRRKEFWQEIEILSRLRHPCIVTVMGAARTRKKEPLLVMEYMEFGSLQDLLVNESFFLEGDLLLPMLSDVAQGMRFLHAGAEVIVHGDLKAGNVLVDTNFRAKVADFGLSSKRKSGVEVGTPAFMAPELLRGETGPTKESDVYAFGIMLFEAFARDSPYRSENWSTIRPQIADNSPDAPLKRPPVPKGCPALVSGLMQECWHKDAESRPTFEEIDRRIRALDVGCVTSQALEAAKKHQLRGSSVETVLFDMFPSHVAEALMQGKKVPPEQKELVTVYFSDIVGFTAISSSLTSSKVSEMLDRLYTVFDELAQKHKVYKIETIGDAYIAVTNLFSDQGTNHAINMARFAVDINEAASATLIDPDDPSKGTIQIRIGLHSGPVVASVIGNKNPKYTLLGDTMNTASRMESTSKPGRMQCTKECADHIMRQDEPIKTVNVLRRGVLHIKGKGNIETFWVQHPDDTVQVTEITGPPTQMSPNGSPNTRRVAGSPPRSPRRNQSQ